MNEAPQPVRPRGYFFSRLFQYFLQGLLVMAPLAITAYAVFWIISTVDSLIPIFTARSPEGQIYVRNYGLGFLLIIGGLVLIGWLSSFLIQVRLFSLFDRWLEKAPGIRFIYSTVKDFFEAFAGEKKRFNHPVIANIDDSDVWRVGFITQENLTELGLSGYVAVYIPASYSIAGNVYLLPPERVRPITAMNPSDAMKFALSGGISREP